MERTLENRVAIVTGAGQGIGEAIARKLAAAGARVAVNDLNPDRASRVAKSINAAGGIGLPIAADVSNKFQCVHLIETTRAEWGRLDILVNNAGIEPVSDILTMDEYDWVRCMEVNLKATFFMSQLCGRVMVDENQDRKTSSIVNIGATNGGTASMTGRAAYHASKAGMVGFARECAREFAAHNIRVNTILPGVIETPATVRLTSDNEIHKQIKAGIPLKRMGSPEDVADAALYLVSDSSRYVTGTTLVVDGGQVG